MKMPAMLLLCLLLGGCAANPAELRIRECAEPAAISAATTPAEEKAGALRSILNRAESLETETAGSGLKWCALAAELMELEPETGCVMPDGVSPETLNRLRSAALLLAGERGTALLEDCGHSPLSRRWSREEILALFRSLSAET